MGSKPEGSSKSLLFLGLILLYSSLVAYRPLRYLGAWSLDPYDWVHWAGISGALLFLAVAVSSWRGVWAKGGWSKVHLLMGVMSLALAALHSRTKAGVILPVHYSSLFILGVMGVVVFSGIALRFFRVKRGAVWWRLVHGGATPALGLVLVHHILVKLAVI
ncbi:MAG: hypothetical protein PVJ38_04000 [Candidatus Bathyarchaeota archaeon]|jgi:hypothetical protein